MGINPALYLSQSTRTPRVLLAHVVPMMADRRCVPDVHILSVQTDYMCTESVGMCAH